MAKWAKSQGWTVKDDAKRYTHFYNPDGNHTAYYPATPSNSFRRMKDLKTDLKAAGLPIPPPSKKEQRAKRDRTKTTSRRSHD
ncbi:MAG: hypothetical protein ACRDU5_15880 [Mycobacterium sp.]